MLDAEAIRRLQRKDRLVNVGCWTVIGVLACVGAWLIWKANNP